MFKFWRILLMLFVVMSGSLIFAQDEDAGVLNIYSARHYGAMEAPFVAFEEATGIEVRVSQGNSRDLLNRLRADIETGGRSVADIFLVIDAGVLSLATEEGLLQAVESDVLNANIAEAFRDPNGFWYGLSIRARTLAYNPDAVSEEELLGINTYADLADPMWVGRMCMRPASHIYTVSLVSSLIDDYGYDEALRIVEGWVANDPIYINSDTRQLQAMAAGECDVALVNHYYMGRLRANEDPAGAMELKWMNQDEELGGVFYNVAGAGVVVNSANYDNAVAFIEFFSTLEGQSGDVNGLPGNNWEYPTNPDAVVNEIIADFGEFNFDLDYSLTDYGSLQGDAVTLLEEAGYGFDES